MMDAQDIQVEVGLPVGEPIEGNGRIIASELAGGRAVHTWHLGPYETLPRAHMELYSWTEDEGLSPTGPFWEAYTTDPEEEPNPNQWRTDLYWPVA